MTVLPEFEFDYGIFTNLSEDHIGPTEHPDFADYLDCKRRLFRQCRIGIINADDPYAQQILEGSTCEIRTFSAEKKADLMASDIRFLMKTADWACILKQAA